jgi:hypothetical protein
MFQYFIALKEEEAWNLIRPIYRELDESVNLGKEFLSGFHSEKKAHIKFILSTVKLPLLKRSL